MRIVTAFWLLAAAQDQLSAASPALFSAIRSGDARAVKAQLTPHPELEAPGESGLTPLMYAVMTAGPPILTLLLDAGADVNKTTDAGMAALHMAAYDLPKTRLLVARGANVNAVTSAGETALAIAADRPGNSAVIAFLLEKGAVASPKEASRFAALLRAATNGDAAAMRLLLSKGATVAGSPELARAAAFAHCRECLDIALAQGADVNVSRLGRTALQEAAAFGDFEMVRKLVERGAHLDAADRRGYTALMRAALSYEPGSPQVVEYLLSKGAATQPKSETGDTALSYALRFGETPVVAALRKVGAPGAQTALQPPPPLPPGKSRTPREAVELSLPLLQRIGEPLSKVRKCTSCHHNSLPAMAVGMARRRGLRVDDAAARQEHETAVSLAPGRRNRTNLIGTGVPDINAFPLIGMAAENPAPSAASDAMVHQVSTRQETSGRFKAVDYRPPQEYSDITFTATALRSMQLYPLPGRAAEFQHRIQRAGQWLLAQTPRDTEEHTLRLMGLVWAGTGKSTRSQAIEALMALQRSDGGWAQTAILPSDAYATGQSLYALQLAGVKSSHSAYQRGVSYLLKNQRPDGSWPVVSRSHPVQPLMDAGYPYGNHQWISAAAGAWSTMALLGAVPVQTSAHATK